MIKRIGFTGDNVEIAAHHRQAVTIYVSADIEEILSELTVQEILQVLGEDEFLDAIGKDAAAEHFDLVESE